MMITPPCQKPQHAPQRGFTLIELSLVLVLMAMAISTFIVLQSQQAADNRARAVAQTYTRMNKAVGGYLQTYYKQLIALPPECSRIYWAANSGTGMATPSFTGCSQSLQLNGGPVTTVVNALQPTPKELASLGFLDGGSAFVDSLPLPTLSSANPTLAFTTGNWLVGSGGGGSSGSILPSRFMVLIQFMCINGGTVSVFNTTGACGSGTLDLRSLVFNSQPYNVQASDPSSQVLYQALDMMGTDGYLSGPGPGTNTPSQDSGELRAAKGAAEPILTNPTRMVSGNAGTPFILALRNGYGSADWSLFKKQLDDLQTQINTMNITIANLNNSLINLQNQVGVSQWTVFRSWESSGYPTLTNLRCNEWSQPAVTTASYGNDSGFSTIVYCSNNDLSRGFWFVGIRNNQGGDQYVDWVSFKGKFNRTTNYGSDPSSNWFNF
jgi:prepilin-type N-terminal cleavage/methylation domain-containing protein